MSASTSKTTIDLLQAQLEAVLFEFEKSGCSLPQYSPSVDGGRVLISCSALHLEPLSDMTVRVSTAGAVEFRADGLRCLADVAAKMADLLDKRQQLMNAIERQQHQQEIEAFRAWKADRARHRADDETANPSAPEGE